MPPPWRCRGFYGASGRLGLVHSPNFQGGGPVTGTLWLTLGEASRLLGVDPDTLRRWADNGKVDVFTTPGGHRRFLRSAIDALLPRPRAVKRPSLTAMGETPDKIAAEVRQRVRR